MSSCRSETAKAGLIAELRSRIATLETGAMPIGPNASRPAVVSFGAASLDDALPGSGLACGALHEVRADDYRDMGASLGFAVALAARCAEAFSDAPVLWCEGARAPFDVGRFYGPGLAAFGLDPARLILVSPASPVDCLWTMEEALRLGAFAAVIGEIDGRLNALSLTATRRLQLMAEENGRPAFLLTGHGKASGTSAAVTRWVVKAAPSGPTVEDAALVGRPRWHTRLEKCRGTSAAAMSDLAARAQCLEWDPRTRLFGDVADRRAAAIAPDFRQAV